MFERSKIDKSLHWTTFYSEKLLLAVIGALTMFAASMDIYEMVISNRIPVTLPIIIAMTALCRLIVLHSKEADPWMLIAEAGAIAVLACAAYIMSYKEKLSLEKKEMKELLK